MAYLLQSTSFNTSTKEVDKVIIESATDSGFNLTQVYTSLPAEAFNHIQIVVPTGRLVRTIEKDIFTSLWNKYSQPSEQPKICTLENLIRQLFAKCKNSLFETEMSDAYRSALFDKIIDDLCAQQELSFFSIEGSSISFHVKEKLAKVAYGLRRDGVNAASLLKEIEEQSKGDSSEWIDYDVRKQYDLQKILSSYERELDKGLIDIPGMIESLLREPELGIDHLELNGTLLIQDFTEFKDPEIKLLSLLQNVGVSIVVHVDYSDQNGPVFGNLFETVSTLEKEGFVKCALNLENGETTKQYLKKYLFNTEDAIGNKELSNLFAFVECNNRTEEIHWVATRIKMEARSCGILPEQIAILCRDVSVYSGLCREILPLYGIPIEVSDRLELDKSSVASLLLNTFNTIRFGFRIEDLYQLLKNPLINNEHNKVNIDAEQLLAYSKMMRFQGGSRRGGKSGWLKALEKFQIRISSKIKTNQDFNQADEIELQNLKHLLEISSILREGLEKFFGHLPSGNLKFSAEEFVDLSKRLLFDVFAVHKEIEIFLNSNLIEPNRNIIIQDQIELDTRALSSLLASLDELQFIERELAPTKLLKFDLWVEKLEAILSSARYQTREKNDFGVLCSTIEQIRGHKFKRVFVCGMVDKEFPQDYVSERFLGKELPDTEERFIRAERTLFYQVLSACQAESETVIFLTYPLFHQNQTYTRSPYIEHLQKITGSIDTLVASSDLQRNVFDKQSYKMEIEFVSNVDLNRRVLFDCNILTKHEPQIGTPSLSITSLETYVACPFKFFAQRELKLSECDNVGVSISSIDQGILLHSIAFYFYNTLYSKFGVKRLHEYDEMDVQYCFNHVVNESWKSVAKHDVYGEIEGTWLLGTDNQKGILNYWLESEIERSKTLQLLPSYFELGFGQKSFSTRIESLRLQNCTINGKIDRIDVSENEFVVIDYKTKMKSIPSKKDVTEHSSLQIPLYILAAQQIDGFTSISQMSGLYVTFYPNFSSQLNQNFSVVLPTESASTKQLLKRSVDSPQTESFLVKTKEFVEARVTELLEGDFSLQPSAKCRYCSYSTVCRLNSITDQHAKS